MHRTTFLLLLLFADAAQALTLTSAQSNYTTTGDITTTANNTSGYGINSTHSGSSSSPRKIKNIHIIHTSGSSAYGIRTSGDYNQITNENTITTTNSTARGISISGDFSSSTNSGTITTSGSSAYGIYVSAGSNSAATSTNYSTVTNSGTINAADAHGIYVNDAYTQVSNSGTISGGEDSADYGISVEGNNSTITNSGTISGTKYAIYNEGSGTVINNSGTLNGGVRIGSATLNISGGSISGTVEGSNSGVVNITGDFTQSSNFSNLSSLNISSGKTFTMNSTYDLDADEISGAGTLKISSSSSFTPENDLTLGNILVGGTLNLSETNNLTLTTNISGRSSATINLGTNNQKISGNFSLLSGDTLSIKGNSKGFGSLEVSGSASVDSNAKLIISSANKYFSSGEKITLITSSDGSGLNNISNIEVNNCRASSCGLLRLSTEISANNLLLNVSRASADELSINNNAKKIYSNLSANNNSKAQDFLSYLDSKDFSNLELESTLTQLAPQSGKARSIGDINVVGNSLKTSEIHLDKIRLGSDNLPAFGKTNFAQIFSPSATPDTFNLNQQGGALRNGFWVQPFGGSALQNPTSDDVGYRTTLSGVSFGLDHEFSSQLTSGASFSVARAETKSLDSLKKTSALTYQLNFYNSQNFRKFFLDSFGGIAFNQYSSERAIPAVSATAKANFNGASYIAKIRAGTTKKINHKINFIPEISASFMHSATGSYHEKGAESLNLNVKSTSSKVLEGRIGAALSFTDKIRELSEFRKFITVIRTSYGYNFINSFDDVVSSFSGQNSTFNSQVSPIDPGSFRVGAEISGYHIEDTIFSVDYQFEKRTTYQSHFVSFKVLQEF